jgi:hypothetical protein
MQAAVNFTDLLVICVPSNTEASAPYRTKNQRLLISRAIRTFATDRASGGFFCLAALCVVRRTGRFLHTREVTKSAALRAAAQN